MKIIVNTELDGRKYVYELRDRKGELLISGQGRTIREAFGNAYEDYIDIKDMEDIELHLN